MLQVILLRNTNNDWDHHCKIAQLISEQRTELGHDRFRMGVVKFCAADTAANFYRRLQRSADSLSCIEHAQGLAGRQNQWKSENYISFYFKCIRFHHPVWNSLFCVIWTVTVTCSYLQNTIMSLHMSSLKLNALCYRGLQQGTSKDASFCKRCQSWYVEESSWSMLHTVGQQHVPFSSTNADGWQINKWMRKQQVQMLLYRCAAGSWWWHNTLII